MKESDLYVALKQLLESQGYAVKGEVLDCDVLAVRGAETPVIIELKVSLTLELILQAVERLSLTPMVYIGIPADSPVFKRRRAHTIKLLRMLGLGLVLIHADRARSRSGRNAQEQPTPRYCLRQLVCRTQAKSPARVRGMRPQALDDARRSA